MDMETTKGRLVLGEDDLVRREEGFDGRKVGVKSEEDKVALWSRDGKETTAIAIAIVGEESLRGYNSLLLFLSSSPT